MDSPINDFQSQISKDKDKNENSNISNEGKIDQKLYDQIEQLIQQQFQIFVPALVFEYRPSTANTSGSKDFSRWDYDDLYEFFSHFGEIELLEIQGKISIILFKSFLDAYTSREFLLNSANYKESERNNFSVRWYSQEDEFYISEIMRAKLKKCSPGQIVETISNTMATLTPSSSNGLNINYPAYFPMGNHSHGISPNPNEYFSTNINSQYNYYANFVLSPEARTEFSGVMTGNSGMRAHPNINSQVPYENDEGKSHIQNDKYLMNGKYTCKYEIQIENDNEFQVARRLIGAKGCNMKKIVELCSRGNDSKYIPDAVKLRLRGRGSGYKEGPYNRESDEPLHLCISSKFFDKYRRACSLVQELIINVYEEYKRFCERNSRTPITNLTIQKEESISTRRNTNSNALIKENNMFVDI